MQKENAFVTLGAAEPMATDNQEFSSPNDSLMLVRGIQDALHARYPLNPVPTAVLLPYGDFGLVMPELKGEFPEQNEDCPYILFFNGIITRARVH